MIFEQRFLFDPYDSVVLSGVGPVYGDSDRGMFLWAWEFRLSDLRRNS